MKQRGLVSDGREPAIPEASAAYRVQVLERALRILDVLAAEGQLAKPGLPSLTASTRSQTQAPRNRRANVPSLENPPGPSSIGAPRK